MGKAVPRIEMGALVKLPLEIDFSYETMLLMVLTDCVLTYIVATNVGGALMMTVDSGTDSAVKPVHGRKHSCCVW